MFRSESATERTAQRIITKNVIALKAIQTLNMTVAKCDYKNDCLEALKITALKAITNDNVTAEAGVGFINDS
jgi:hypothetical protein